MNQNNERMSSRPAALCRFGLAATGAALAASAWAAGAADLALLEDGGARGGWYALTVSSGAVQVRASAPDRADADAGDALYVHVPGTRLAEGLRVNHLFQDGPLRPRAGQDYAFGLGKTAFSFRVDSDAAGTQYVIRYGDASYSYPLGLPAAHTEVRAIADLDGDRLPDFLVAIGDELYLLLSSHAQPGANLPSAQLWAAG